MAVALNRDAVEPAATELVQALRRRGKIIDDPENVVVLVVRAYLEAHRVRQVSNTRISPSTRAMAALEPGQKIPVEVAAVQILRSRMKTARKLMENSEARWAVHATGVGTYLVTRLKDGEAPRRDPWHNQRAAFLAQLKPGQKALASGFKNRASMSTNLKVAARRLLENNTADWRAWTTARGVMVERTV